MFIFKSAVSPSPHWKSVYFHLVPFSNDKCSFIWFTLEFLVQFNLFLPYFCDTNHLGQKLVFWPWRILESEIIWIDLKRDHIRIVGSDINKFVEKCLKTTQCLTRGFWGDSSKVELYVMDPNLWFKLWKITFKIQPIIDQNLAITWQESRIIVTVDSCYYLIRLVIEFNWPRRIWSFNISIYR